MSRALSEKTITIQNRCPNRCPHSSYICLNSSYIPTAKKQQVIGEEEVQAAFALLGYGNRDWGKGAVNAFRPEDMVRWDEKGQVALEGNSVFLVA